MVQYYDNEKHGVVFFIDTKSFYASVEAVEHGYNPLTVPLVVLSTGPNVGGGGLILATSPTAKKLYHLKNNVSRKRDMPKDPRLKVYPPRMNLYIKKNMELNSIYRTYTDEEHVHPYSIDESLVDVSESWKLFGSTPVEVARKIQIEIHDKTGLYVTVGIGNNPIQAKIALDVYAKKTKSLIGEIYFETIKDRLWTIDELTDIWSIGKRTANKLNNLGIYSLYDLAHFNPYELQNQFGVMGSQLYALSWGIDRSDVTQKIPVKSKSLSNAQVLPRNYQNADELKIVLREVTEQVAARVRAHHKFTTSVGVYVGNEYSGSGFHKQQKVSPTNSSKVLWKIVENIFDHNYHGDTIRNVGISMGNLITDQFLQLNLFEGIEYFQKNMNLDNTVDQIRNRFGFTKMMKLSSTQKGGTAIGRLGLVGGHNGGNAYE